MTDRAASEFRERVLGTADIVFMVMAAGGVLLALLLWPLDIGLRRVSVGRRELADARRWVTGGWRQRGVSPRPVEIAGMLAARDRASGAAARAAIIHGDSAPRPTQAAPPLTSAPQPTPARVRPAERAPSATLPAAPPPAATPTAADPSAPKPADAADTLSRLRDAKRRARGN